MMIPKNFTKNSTVNPKERRLLFDLAKKCQKDSSIVEIGSFKGGSTIILAKGTMQGNSCKIYAIDPHTGSPEHNKGSPKFSTFKEFKKNILSANVSKQITPLIMTSGRAREIWKKGKIGFLFIDGNHEYNFVKKDFLLWKGLVVEGGFIAFHDTLMGGARKVVNEFLYRSYFKKIRYKSSITYAIKDTKKSFLDELDNIFSHFLRNIYLRSRWIYYWLREKKYIF